MNRGRLARLRAWATSRPTAFWLLAMLAVLTFMMGGGARDDIRSLLLLRPLTALLLVGAMAVALPDAWRHGRALLLLAAASLLAVLVQLIPLPPGLWSALGGREPVIAMYRAAGVALPALPLSLTPAATWNAAFALMTPIAGLMLGLVLDRDDRLLMLRLLIAVALVSALIGLLQVIGSADGPLYFYRITNQGNAVGLFANRNHQAMLLASLFPMLAAQAVLMASVRNASRLILPMTMVLWGFLIPLLLVTGSRAGLILGVVGLIFAVWILRLAKAGDARHVLSRRRIMLLGGLGLAILAGVIALTLSRATAVQRLINGGDDADVRFEALPIIWQAARDFFPSGSGYGSFADIYRIYEPAQMLNPNYLNHAHNDFIELLLTGGLPALLLLAVGGVLFGGGVLRMLRLKADRAREPAVMARAGCAVIVILVLGSVADYPLRAPSLALLAAIMVAFWSRSVMRQSAVSSTSNGLAAETLVPASSTIIRSTG